MLFALDEKKIEFFTDIVYYMYNIKISVRRMIYIFVSKFCTKYYKIKRCGV